MGVCISSSETAELNRRIQKLEAENALLAERIHEWIEHGDDDEPYATELPPIKTTSKKTRFKYKNLKIQRCVVCMERFPSAVQIPCGHLTTCLHCLHRMKTRNQLVTCGTCRKPIERVIVPYV